MAKNNDMTIETFQGGDGRWRVKIVFDDGREDLCVASFASAAAAEQAALHRILYRTRRADAG